MKVFPVILEYCGGEQTDKLYHQLSFQNPNYTINVLDNASEHNKCNVISHQNEVNTYTGGGILDCIELAKNHKAEYLLYFANDLQFEQIDIAELEKAMDNDADIVHLSLTLTHDSSIPWSWMKRQGKGLRQVCHSDLLASMIRLDFVTSLQFPKSKSGWGYDFQIGYEALLQDKKVVMCDDYSVLHINTDSELVSKQKRAEMDEIYYKKYGADIIKLCLNEWENRA
jgi:hypothetical protein